MRFDYCNNCTSYPNSISRELFEKLIRSPWVRALCDEIAAGHLERKRDLPAVCWQAAFDGKKRSNQYALPSGLFALDVDHVDHPEAIFRALEDRIDELGIYVVHKTPSTRGLRLVARCRPEFGSIGENQAWLADEIHVEHDACTRDFARLSFLVPESYFYYYNPAIFSDRPTFVLQNKDWVGEEAASETSGQQSSENGQAPTAGSGLTSTAGNGQTGTVAGQAVSENGQAASETRGQQSSENGQAETAGNGQTATTGSGQTATAGNGLTSTAGNGQTGTVAGQTIKEANGRTSTVKGGTTSQPPLSFRGIPYSEIVTELIQRTGGEPYEGERNNRLYLICRLLANITDRQPNRIFQICPRFGLSEQEVRSCCESACKSARTEKLPFVLYKVLRDLGIDPNGNNVREGKPKRSGSTGGSRTASRDAFSEEAADDEASLEARDLLEVDSTPIARPVIRLLPESHYPPLIREFMQTAPEDFKVATAMSCLPICGFLASRVRAYYLDGELQAPSFIVNVIAPAASGKGSLLRIADICLEQIRAQDDIGRQEEAEYQRQMRLKKNQKQQVEEPQPIVRDIPAKVSVAQLLKRMVQARGLHLISVSAEADTLTNSNKSGVWAQKSDIYRIAQDGDGGRYGQDYKSDISFSATCKMRYNLLTLGTPGAIARAYPDVEDGLITRCIMVELPSQFGKPMPIRKPFTGRQMRVIQERIQALMALSQDEAGNVLPEYRLNLSWLNEGIEGWIEQQRLRSVRDDDHARDQFMRRAAQIGFRAGMVATVLWGKLNAERKGYVIEFALWTADLILNTLHGRYAPKVNEQAMQYEIPVARRYPSLFEAMGDVFTLGDLQKAAHAQSIHSPLKNIIFRWTENRIIEKQGDTFVKLMN